RNLRHVGGAILHATQGCGVSSSRCPVPGVTVERRRLTTKERPLSRCARFGCNLSCTRSSASADTAKKWARQQRGGRHLGQAAGIWWRRRESNPRPEPPRPGVYACSRRSIVGARLARRRALSCAYPSKFSSFGPTNEP